MKQRDWVNKLISAGFSFERHGGNHDIYRRGLEIENGNVNKSAVEIYPKFLKLL